VTQDEIIEMARQAGIKRRTDEFYSEFCDGIYFDDLEAYTKLVAAKEREACLKACEKIKIDLSNWPAAFEGVTAETKFMRSMGEIIAQPFIEAIQLRGQA
jgi:hypothetical protein